MDIPGISVWIVFFGNIPGSTEQTTVWWKWSPRDQEEWGERRETTLTLMTDFPPQVFTFFTILTLALTQGNVSDKEGTLKLQSIPNTVTGKYSIHCK